MADLDNYNFETGDYIAEVEALGVDVNGIPLGQIEADTGAELVESLYEVLYESDSDGVESEAKQAIADYVVRRAKHQSVNGEQAFLRGEFNAFLGEGFCDGGDGWVGGTLEYLDVLRRYLASGADLDIDTASTLLGLIGIRALHQERGGVEFYDLFLDPEVPYWSGFGDHIVYLQGNALRGFDRDARETSAYAAHSSGMIDFANGYKLYINACLNVVYVNDENVIALDYSQNPGLKFHENTFMKREQLPTEEDIWAIDRPLIRVGTLNQALEDLGVEGYSVETEVDAILHLIQEQASEYAKSHGQEDPIAMHFAATAAQIEKLRQVDSEDWLVVPLDDVEVNNIGIGEDEPNFERYIYEERYLNAVWDILVSMGFVLEDDPAGSLVFAPKVPAAVRIMHYNPESIELYLRSLYRRSWHYFDGFERVPEGDGRTTDHGSYWGQIQRETLRKLPARARTNLENDDIIQQF